MKALKKQQITKKLASINKYKKDLNDPKQMKNVTLPMSLGLYTCLKVMGRTLKKTPEEFILMLVNEGITPPKKSATKLETLSEGFAAQEK